MSPDQEAYVEFHSQENKAVRMKAAREETEKVVTEAHTLFFSGDRVGARELLLSAGLNMEGVCYYLDAWSSP